MARPEGALLLGGYAAYTAYLALSSVAHPALPEFAAAMLTLVLPAAGALLAASMALEFVPRGSRPAA